MRRFLSITGVVLIGSASAVSMAISPPRRCLDPTKTYRVPGEGAPSRGAAVAKVTIIEFSNFTCDACFSVASHLGDVLRSHPNDVRLVFHIIERVGDNDEKVFAARAAAKLGKFWDFHDLLFSDPAAFRNRSDTDAATKLLGVDRATFLRAFNAAAREHDPLAGRFGVLDVPTLFVNGRVVLGAPSVDTLEKIVSEEIGRADGLLAKRVKPEDLYDALTRDGKTEADTETRVRRCPPPSQQ
jgi:protein-disulfide isomerase